MIDQSMGKYNPIGSEQPEGGGFSLPGVPQGHFSHARALAVLIRNAETKVGGALQLRGREATLAERMEHVLLLANGSKLSPRHYQICWFVKQTLNEHVLSEDAPSPVVIGDSA